MYEDNDYADTSYDELERDHDEQYEPEYDGQPDEAQEWHDFGERYDDEF